MSEENVVNVVAEPVNMPVVEAAAVEPVVQAIQTVPVQELRIPVDTKKIVDFTKFDKKDYAAFGATVLTTVVATKVTEKWIIPFVKNTVKGVKTVFGYLKNPAIVVDQNTEPDQKQGQQPAPAPANEIPIPQQNATDAAAPQNQ